MIAAPMMPTTGTAMHELAAPRVTRASFAPFGDLIEGAADGIPFGPNDAALELTAGRPRLYIMQLPPRGLAFRQITRHRRVTQCLAAVGGRPWFIAVAPPDGVDDPSAEPAADAIRGFKIPGDVAIKLHRGTWHAGPLFEGEHISFLNLELTDTNETDHQNSYLEKRFGTPFCLVPTA
jgi:ureidoglycolate hydrolase